MQSRSIEVATGRDPVAVAFRLEPLARFLSEITVSPSRYTLYEETPEVRTSLSREDVSRLPHFGEDPFRAVRWLPGTSGEDLSSQINVRGGETNETLVLLDGLEIQDGYHLKELFNMLSIVDAEIIDGLEFTSGGFPVSFGNRMSSVIDMTSSNAGPARTSLALSTTNLSLLSEGYFAGGRGRWTVSARRTDLDMVIEWVDPENGLEPSFGDAFAKISYLLGERSSFAAEALLSTDDTHYTEENGHLEELMDASSSNGYAWLSVKTAWTPRLLSQTVLSTGRVEQEREGFVDYWYQEGTVDDERSFDVVGFKQDWSLDFADRHVLLWGFDVRSQEASYDYSSRSIVWDPLYLEGGEPHVTDRDYDLDPEGDSFGVYLADRFRLAEPLVVEVGARWDRQTYTGHDDQWSPRATVSWELADSTTMRAAWGLFHQAQHINDLQVADGITTFWPAQRAEHRLLSLEHDISTNYDVRVELYEKKLTDVRPHYENLFNPIEIFPEIEADRVLVAPDRSRAEGVEITVRRNGGRRLSWWLSYAWAKAEDEIDGSWVPRSWDQRHSANFVVNYRPKDKWNFNLAGSYHTGWPTTGIEGEIVYDDNGYAYVVAHLQERNGERLPYYLRIDFRASRTFQLRRSSCEVFLEVTNLLNRDNTARPEGFGYSSNPDGSLDIEVEWEGWMPLIPALGFRWTF
jgi:outer membrane receptor protein involved in Fe transport